MATTLFAMPLNTTTNTFKASQNLLRKSSPPKQNTEASSSTFVSSVPNVTKVSHGFSTAATFTSTKGPIATNTTPSNVMNSSALDALATLATSAVTIPPQDNNNDFDTMPPPPPRRSRSASNPEGMEKWDSYHYQNKRTHFVLPSTILEEELASANVACQVHEEEQAQQQQQSLCFVRQTTRAGPPKKRALTVFRLNHLKDDTNKQQQEDSGSSPTTVIKEEEEVPSVPIVEEEEESNNAIDEKDLEPDELLRRARSRLLEDLATETNVEKTVHPLPHALDKYKSIYNKNGRVGIYTPLERAAIIAKFNTKRGRRVWNKKIRYNCRKNLADRRMRVKGRFVKRAVEQQQEDPTVSSTPTQSINNHQNELLKSSSTEDTDVNMPDVNDPEAGFSPTASQPFRRVRRHTIT